MEPLIQLRITPEPDDYARVMRIVYRRQKAAWVSGILLGIAFVFGLIFAGQLPLGWVFLLPLPLYIVYVSVFMPMTMRQRARSNPRMLAETSYGFGEDRISIKNQFRESELEWGALRECLETEHYFLLSMSADKPLFQFIPKRSFESADQMDAFRSLARRKVPVS